MVLLLNGFLVVLMFRKLPTISKSLYVIWCFKYFWSYCMKYKLWFFFGFCVIENRTLWRKFYSNFIQNQLETYITWVSLWSIKVIFGHNIVALTETLEGAHALRKIVKMKLYLVCGEFGFESDLFNNCFVFDVVIL